MTGVPLGGDPREPAAEVARETRVLVLTGMSGAGKTTALHALEDVGYLAVDNAPPSTWPAIADRVHRTGVTRLALGCDVRGEPFLPDIPASLDELQVQGWAPRVIYLDAEDEALVRRFNFTRRTHPLGSGPLSADLARERMALEPLRSRADLVIDTSALGPKELRARLQQLSGGTRFALKLVSFGYKRGIPTDADVVLDVRGLPNPFYDESLRRLPGSDPEVQGYVFAGGGLESYTRLREMVRELAEAARQTGRSNYAVAVGCTGGQHRSVAVVARLSLDLAERFEPEEHHRDLAAALGEHDVAEGSERT